MLDSSAASAPITTASLSPAANGASTSAASPLDGVRSPAGTIQLPMSSANTASLTMLASSSTARYGPEYSSTIASWTIVSSRCVAGLSTGYRAVSPSATRASAATAGRSHGWATRPAPATESMPSTVSEPDATANALKVTISAGSRKAEIVISRLAPMPPNALAESRPARTMKTAPSIQTPATTSRCDSGAAAPPRETSGSTAADTSEVANTANGATRNTQDVLDERTTSFRISVRIVQ